MNPAEKDIQEIPPETDLKDNDSTHIIPEGKSGISKDTSKLVMDIKRNSKIYAKIPKKLGKKSDMISKLLGLYKSTGKKCPYSLNKLEKNIKRDEIWRMTQDLEGEKPKGKKGVVSSLIDSVPEIKITAKLKQNAAELLFDAECVTIGITENYLTKRPGIGIDLDGMTNQMVAKEKKFKSQLRAVVDCYPGIARFLNPIIVHLASVTREGVDTHVKNKKNQRTAEPNPRRQKPSGDTKKSSVSSKTVLQPKGKGKDIPMLVSFGASVS